VIYLHALPLLTSIQAQDIQYAIGLTTGVPVTFISTGTQKNDDFVELLDQANYLLSLEHPPQTILNNVAGMEGEVTAQIAKCVFRPAFHPLIR
jgi:tripeptidyl-peptidase-1